MPVEIHIPEYDPHEGFIYTGKNLIIQRPGESDEETRIRAIQTFEDVKYAPGFEGAVLRAHENGCYVICTKPRTDQISGRRLG